MYNHSDISSIEIFDGHMHIIDKRYPLVENNGFLPKEFTVEDYIKKTSTFKSVGGAVVSGSFQSFDQTYLLDALKKLGKSFVGVTQLRFNVKDDEIMHLHNAGVRALRFNVKRGGSADIKFLVEMAERVNSLAGWHVELYIESAQLEDMTETILSLPAVSIDHLGLSKAGFNTLLRLVERGVWVKATGFGRVDFDVRQALKDLFNANPESLIFGTDLPSTRAPRPYDDADIITVLDVLGDDSHKIFVENAMKLYFKRI